MRKNRKKNWRTIRHKKHKLERFNDEEINETRALIRLLDNNSYTIDEIVTIGLANEEKKQN